MAKSDTVQEVKDKQNEWQRKSREKKANQKKLDAKRARGRGYTQKHRAKKNGNEAQQATMPFPNPLSVLMTPKKKSLRENFEDFVSEVAAGKPVDPNAAAVMTATSGLLEREVGLQEREESTKAEALKLKTQEEATKTQAEATKTELASVQKNKELGLAYEKGERMEIASTQKSKQQKDTYSTIKDTSNTLAANGHDISDFSDAALNLATKPPAKSPAKSPGKRCLFPTMEAGSKLNKEEEEDDCEVEDSSPVAKKTPAKKKAPPQPPAETATATPVKKSAGNEKSAPPSALRRSARKKSAPNTLDL